MRPAPFFLETEEKHIFDVPNVEAAQQLARQLRKNGWTGWLGIYQRTDIEDISSEPGAGIVWDWNEVLVDDNL